MKKAWRGVILIQSATLEAPKVQKQTFYIPNLGSDEVQKCLHKNWSGSGGSGCILGSGFSMGSLKQLSETEKWAFSKGRRPRGCTLVKIAKVLGLGPLHFCFGTQSQNFNFLFLVPNPALWAHPTTMLHNIRKYPQPVWLGIPFTKKSKFQQFLVAGITIFMSLFSPAKGQNSKFRSQLSLPCCRHSQKVWHTLLTSKSWEEIYLAETPLLDQIHQPENYLLGVGAPLKILCSSMAWVKCFFCSHAKMSRLADKWIHWWRDARTDTHFSTSPVPLGDIFCFYDLGKYNFKPWEISSISLCLLHSWRNTGWVNFKSVGWFSAVICGVPEASCSSH